MRLSGLAKIAGVTLVLGLVAGAAYAVLLPGLSRANQETAPLEKEIATWLLQHSVPESAVKAVNPLGPKVAQAEITAGRDLFRAKCETCHAYDGGGRTEIGGNVLPRAPALHQITPGLPITKQEVPAVNASPAICRKFCQNFRAVHLSRPTRSIS